MPTQLIQLCECPCCPQPCSDICPPNCGDEICDTILMASVEWLTCNCDPTTCAGCTGGYDVEIRTDGACSVWEDQGNPSCRVISFVVRKCRPEPFFQPWSLCLGEGQIVDNPEAEACGQCKAMAIVSCDPFILQGEVTIPATHGPGGDPCGCAGSRIRVTVTRLP
jgi:hypothetical protein